MSKNVFFVIAIAAFAIACIMLSRSCSTPYGDNTEDAKVDSLLTKIESLTSTVNDLKDTISARDSAVAASSASVASNVKVVRETIREYRLIHDTIQRLVACDSIVLECEELASECAENDSIHTIQERDMKAVILNQDTIISAREQIISIKDSQIIDQKKIVGRLKVACGALAILSLAIFVLK